MVIEAFIYINTHRIDLSLFLQIPIKLYRNYLYKPCLFMVINHNLCLYMYFHIDYIISVANFIKIPMKETCVSKYAKDFELK